MRGLSLKAVSIAALLLLPACATTIAQDPRTVRVPVTFSAEDLDNLVAPIALYPDPLLAQVLIAATFPDQVELAAEFVRERGTRDVDNQNWDLSVRAVAHYPPVLNMLYQDEDWTTALGQAYAAQSSDVMDAVQRLREMANAQGNLVTTEEQSVVVERERIVIVPANPRVIYVPTYDPGVVFFRPVVHLGFRTGFWSFGVGFPIGDWLVYDVDWYGRRVYYDGWYGGGWRAYARPYIVLRPIYVHPRHRVVRVGNVYGRIVNYFNLERSHRRIHDRVTWERRGRDWRPNERGPRWNGNDRGSRSGPVGDRDGRRDDGRRGLDNPQRGSDRTPTFGTLRPDRSAPGGAVRKVEAPTTRSGLGSVVKTRTEAAPRQPVARGGLVVTPRASSAEPRPSTRSSQVERTTRSSPPVIRSVPSKSAPPRQATRSTPPVIRSLPSKSAPPRQATRSTPPVIRSLPSKSVPPRQATRPTVRVQTTKPAKAAAASSGAKVKSAPARGSAGSVRGKGKGGN
jgi:hypothetical protein